MVRRVRVGTGHGRVGRWGLARQAPVDTSGDQDQRLDPEAVRDSQDRAREDSGHHGRVGRLGLVPGDRVGRDREWVADDRGSVDRARDSAEDRPGRVARRVQPRLPLRSR